MRPRLILIALAGLGRAVVAGLCRILLDQGIRPRLFHETHNETASGLYRSLGFERCLPCLTVDFLERSLPC